MKTVEWEGIAWVWEREIVPTPQKSCNGCENPEPGSLQVFVAVDPNGAKVEARWCRTCIEIVECDQVRGKV